MNGLKLQILNTRKHSNEQEVLSSLEVLDEPIYGNYLQGTPGI